MGRLPIRFARAHRGCDRQNHRHQHHPVRRQRGGDCPRLPQSAAARAHVGHSSRRRGRRGAAHYLHGDHSALVGIPWLQLIGGLLLFWIAVKLLIADEPDDDSVASGSNLWEAVKIVAIADIVMSLDNVLAIAAAAMQAPAEQQILLIVFGLVISIPLVIAGSTLIMSLLARYPVLVWAGAALLGWIAGELLVTDLVSVTQIQAWDPALVVVDPESAAGLRPVGLILYSAATVGALIVLLVGWMLLRRRSRGAVGIPGQEGGPAE